MKKPDEETNDAKKGMSRSEEIRKAWYEARKHRDGYADEHEPEDDDDEALNM